MKYRAFISPLRSYISSMSSGGAAHTAIELAKELQEGVIVFIVCDRGDRYLSSDLLD